MPGYGSRGTFDLLREDLVCRQGDGRAGKLRGKDFASR